MSFMEWLETVRCEHETVAHLQWLQEEYELWGESGGSVDKSTRPPPDDEE